MNVHQDVHYGITYNEAIGNKVLAINRQFIDTTRHGREKSRHVLLLRGEWKIQTVYLQCRSAERSRENRVSVCRS